MKLSSCKNCGVVIDLHVRTLPDEIHNENGVDETKAIWCCDADDYVPFVECPVCENPVTGSGALTWGLS